MVCNKNMVAVVHLMVEAERQDPYCDKQLMRADRGRGLCHTMQMISGSGRECYETVRMNPETFVKLCDTLKNDYHTEGYWNVRKQFPSMNVLAICNFDMKFIYAYVETPGRAHDTKVLTYCAQEDMFFPKPQEGKYFVVDSGYPNRKGYLAPYRKTRYHPHQWGEGPPSSASEMFNKQHSSLRSVIERTFGVWKAKWRILKNEARYCLQTQCKIVVATMTLHNFICGSAIIDDDLEEYERMDEDILNLPESNTRYEPTGDAYMSGIRNNIAESIWTARQ